MINHYKVYRYVNIPVNLIQNVYFTRTIPIISTQNLPLEYHFYIIHFTITLQCILFQ